MTKAMMESNSEKQRGMGLIIALALMSVVALSVGIMAPAVYEVISADKVKNTLADLQSLKVAIAGNPTLANAGGRSDYGYIGTMGGPPSNLANLWLRGSQNAYLFDSLKKVGAGWLGPYLPAKIDDDLLALDKDRWGNPFVLTTTSFVRSSDGQTVQFRVRSLGPDGTINTPDDMWVDLLRSEIFSTVTGTLVQKTQPINYAAVTLNQPVNGQPASTTTTTNANGVYTFSNVSYGFRSVSVEAKLAFKSGSIVLTQSGSFMKFNVTNAGGADVVFTSFKATYNFTAWYETLKIGNNTLYNSTNPRAASGQTLTFAAQTVKGSGLPQQIQAMRVESAETTLPAINLLSQGATVTINMGPFKNASSGSASSVSVSGKTFTLNFFTTTPSDGSEVTFTVP